MTLRNTRFGRWVRRHPRLHAFVHATWCRMLGPLDTKRVASSSGTSTVVQPPPTKGPYTSFVVFYSTGGGVQYTTTTQSDALAWAKANTPVGVTWAIFGIGTGGQTFITSGLGTDTSAAAINTADVNQDILDGTVTNLQGGTPPPVGNAPVNLATSSQTVFNAITNNGGLPTGSSLSYTGNVAAYQAPPPFNIFVRSKATGLVVWSGSSPNTGTDADNNSVAALQAFAASYSPALYTVSNS